MGKLLNFTILTLCMGLLLGCESGCKAGKGRYDPATWTYDTNAPADKVVVTAQNVRATALDAFYLLWKTEKQFRQEAWDLTPKIKEFADYTRANSEKWLDSLTEQIENYQRARTPENKLKLDGALQVVQKAIEQAREYTAQAVAAKPNP